MTIDQIIASIIKREGGYVNHPNDRGGPTKYGVTIRTLSHWQGIECNAEDVKALSKKEAAEIYLKNYYLSPKIDFLTEALRPFMLDASVHHGPRNAIKLLQETLLRNGKNVGPIDGIIGRKTLVAAEKSWKEQGERLIKQLASTRTGFCERIVKHDETQRVFLPGWIARIEKFIPENIA